MDPGSTESKTQPKAAKPLLSHLLPEFASLKAFANELTMGRMGGIAMIILFVALRVWDPVPLQTLRGKTFDLYQSIQPRSEEAHPVTIVDIDEKSLTELGQWPWSRGIIADLVDKLAEAGVKVVGFDVLFAEPDRLSPQRIVTNLELADEDIRTALASLPDTDKQFATAMTKVPTVLGLAGRPTDTENTFESQAATFATLGGDPRPHLIGFPGHVANVPQLMSSAAGHGVVSVVPDYDGIVRRVPTIINLENALAPSLSIEMMRIATKTDALLIKSDQAGMQSLVVRGAGREIATDRDGQLWVHFTKHDPDRFVSAADVLNGQVPADKLSGKIALVGASAIGLLDLRATPVERVMPGVEIHAQVIESILSGTLLTRPNYALGAELLLSILTGLAIVIAVPMLGARPTLLLGCLVASILVAGAWWMFRVEHTLIDVIYPLASSLAIFITLTFANYFREEKRRAQIRTAFRHYLAPELVEQLSREPERLVLGGETREMSILFSDVRGFSSIAEGFKTNPSGLTRLMNQLLTPLSKAIIERGGTIDKYIGDAIMAFWNAPLADENHAANACHAAKELAARLENLNNDLRADRDVQDGTIPHMEMGVGIATGLAVVGNMGSDIRFDYSVMGDTVNLAARLEGLTALYGVSNLISARTAKLCGDDLAIIELDRVRVKGKKEPETIFSVLAGIEVKSAPEFAELTSAFADMRRHYQSQSWGEALDALELCQENRYAQPLATALKVYRDRIEAYAEKPPSSDWDGVWNAVTKKPGA